MGSSTLTTSAPSHASASVHEGPASNCVRSRTLTPCNAGVVTDVRSCVATLSSISLHSHLVFLGVSSGEPAELLRLAAGAGMQLHIHQRRAIELHRLVEGAAQMLGVLDVPALAAEGLHHAVVAGTDGKHPGRRLETLVRQFIDAPGDAAVVQDHDLHGQLVAAGGLDLHAREADG